MTMAMMNLLADVTIEGSMGRGVKVGAIIFSVFAAAGLIFVIVSLLKKISKCNVELEAEISDISTKDMNGTTTYAPVYSYYYEGQAYEQTSGVYVNTPGYRVGEKVTIHINPNKPEMLLDKKRDLKTLIVFAVVFALFLVIGICMLLVK